MIEKDNEELGHCDLCGEFTVVFLSGDPFIEEIYPGAETKERFWCYACYKERLDDI